MTYQNALRTHLTIYKQSVLSIAESETFPFRGRSVICRHILPPGHEWSNVPEPVREPLRAYLKRHPLIKRHRFFHHLNSSQAFAFNLFFLADKTSVVAIEDVIATLCADPQSSTELTRIAHLLREKYLPN